MEQATRNKLRNVVTQCRKLLEESIAQQLQGTFGIYAGKKDAVQIEDEARMSHLSVEDQQYRRDLLDHFEHIKARGFKPKDALDQLIRETAFTHLNRLCAYKMMEARDVYVGGQKFREAVSRGINSNGFKFYLADHPEDERLFNTGNQDLAYRNFLDWLGALLSEEIGVLFSPNDPANRLYPRLKTLNELLVLLNDEDLAGIWEQDETIGWVYQYFTPKELRDQARSESAAPRNSYELAFRNQFFTPRYVVEFLTDNTLGRTWYEMRQGNTNLKDRCRYFVCHSNETFLNEGQEPTATSDDKAHSQGGDLLQQAVQIPFRPKKDPRDLKILDPMCGSGHFLLYCFDLLLTIYQEAYDDPDLGPVLTNDFPNKHDFFKQIPALILANNLHGIDIDLRATQIAALALWLRCQREFHGMAVKGDRPAITRSHIVCAEPMPGESDMLDEFIATLEPKVVGQLVEVVFEKMKLAGQLGSLLYLSEEIRSAIADAKNQWIAETERATDNKGRQLLFSRAEMDRLGGKARQGQRFDVLDVTDDQFFEKAEHRVLQSLHQYAASALTDRQHQRQLFADDAEHGFAFVNTCHTQYDVVLMNPPFGDAIPGTRAYLKDHYASTYNDIGMCSVDRGYSLLTDRGFVGAITSRTFLANESMAEWRKERLLGNHSSLSVFADLGYGVLDEALVEAAAYVITRSGAVKSVVFNSVLSTTKKEETLQRITGTRQNALSTTQHLDVFLAIPGAVICYWVPEQMLRACLEMPNLSTLSSEARVGLQTGDNFRFIRTTWEVPPERIGTTQEWTFYAKGGEYEPFYDDIHLLINWEEDGKTIRSFTADDGRLLSRPQNTQFYCKQGITYPDRTTSDFSPRIMPSGIIFSDAERALFPASRESLLGYLGAAYSRPFKVLVEAFVGSGDSSVSGSAARHYRPGVLNVLPNLLVDPSPHVSAAVLESLTLRVRAFNGDETTRYFRSPLISLLGKTLRGSAIAAFRQSLSDCTRVIELNKIIETEIVEAFNDPNMPATLDALYGPHPADYSRECDVEFDTDRLFSLFDMSDLELVSLARSELGASRQVIKKSYFADRKLELVCHLCRIHPTTVAEVLTGTSYCPSEAVTATARSIVSYGVGTAIGRWDIRNVGEIESEEGADPFCPLPTCAPGALAAVDGDSLPTEYRKRIDWDGILVDDVDHDDDIIRHVRETLEVIWGERADSVESEICELLGYRDLRDYFRKLGNGGFWDDHIRRYSKSRRKAPIYWLLQSSKKNYGVWLYYHRLDKDMLFKALLIYVEPKIQREINRLGELRSQKTSAGESGSKAKKLDRDIEKQEDLLSELRDFEEKLRKAAELHLVPDLNDGVVLNIASLHELIPWKEAKKYWGQLMDGKYEWSSIGKQLREKGLVK